MNSSAQKLTTVSHPLAGQSMTGAEIIVQVLADQGVNVIFGYSGGAILPTYDAVFRFNSRHKDAAGKEPMPLIVPANEQGMLQGGLASVTSITSILGPLIATNLFGFFISEKAPVTVRISQGR